MAKRIFEKAELIPGFQPGARGAPSALDRETKSKTAPGTMMGFLTAQSGAAKEAEALRAEVEALKRSAPLQKLDTALVRPSKWANRHAATFASQDFDTLKAEIQAAGENVQPIKVRPVRLPEESKATSPTTYEIVYGHRRHRACLELGLPVTAVIEPLDDLDLFQQMERENRGRKNLSAWEQGRMYRRALDEGLYSSQRKLADALGVDISLVSKSLSLARLPDEIVEAFASPLDIQFRWSAVLADALQKDPDGVLARARGLKEERSTFKASDILERLLRPPEDKASSPVAIPIQRSSKTIGLLRIDATGRLQLSLNAGVATPAKGRALAKLIEDFLAS